MLLLNLFIILSTMNLNILAWNVRGIMSSTMCLANLLDQYDSDIVIVSEHKLKPNSGMYMNSIDSRYTSVSKSDRLGSGYNCTHGKGGISIMYRQRYNWLLIKYIKLILRE
jgi:exonuclease III